MASKRQEDSDSSINKINNISLKIVRAISNTISNKRDRLLINVLYEAGCTVSELVKIKVADVKTNSIIVGKQRRKVEISLELREGINNFLKQNSSEFLFSTRQSPTLHVRRVEQIVKKYVSTNPTQLRHARIIELAKKKEIKEVKKSTGLKHLKTKSFLKKEEIQKLQNIIENKKDSILFNLLLETGCLISELVELKVEDVKEKSIFVGKKDVKISDKLASNLQEFIKKNQLTNFLFTTRQSTKISNKRIFQILKYYGKQAGIALNQRILRNTKLVGMLRENETTIETQLGIKRLEFGSYGLLNKNG